MTMNRTRTIFLAAIPMLMLTGCGDDGEPRTPTAPAWFSTTSPTGRTVECLWVGDYGGVTAHSFQAEMQCWQVARD